MKKVNEQGNSAEGGDRSRSEEFVRLLTRFQPELYVYVAALLGNSERAHDVLQEANIYIWKKAETYDYSRPFLPWAKTLAWAQVRKFWLYRKREQQRVVFDEKLFEVVSEKLANEEDEESDLLEALEFCLKRLRPKESEVITLHYFERLGLNEMAELLHASVSALTSRLMRARVALGDCIIRRRCSLNHEGRGYK